MGPLSGKQQREWDKHHAKEARESAKMESEEARKNQLHEIKLQEAAAKANQGIGHKEEVHGLKLKEIGGPLGKSKKVNRQKIGLPSQNPLAGAEVFGQGQHMLAKGTDTVPAMLTPGEAVIPKAAAQDPKNKPLIKQMVQQGRMANKVKGYAMGTEEVPNMTANYYHTDSAAALADGTEEVQLSMNSGFTSDLPTGYAPVDVPQMVSEGVQVAGPVGGDDFQRQLVEKRLAREAELKQGTVTNKQDRSAEYKQALENVPTAIPVPGFNRMGNVAPVVPTNEYVDGKTSQPKPVSIQEVSAEPLVVPQPVVFSKPTGEDAWVAAQESAGDVNAKNPNSSARGLYQMTDNAWKDAVLVNPNLKTVDRTTVEGQQAGRDAYKAALSKQLSAKGITPTEEAIRKAWVVGAGGYSNILNGAPNAPLAVSKEAMAINPNLQGKTNAEFIADANPYSRKGAIPQPRMEADPSSPEQQRLAADYKNFKKGGPLPEGAPAEIIDRDARVAEYAKSLSQDAEFNSKVDSIVASKTAPEEKKSLLTRMFENVYGPTGIFNERDLTRFALEASASKLLGYNTTQSLRFAGRDTLAQADARYARQQGYEQQEKLQDRSDARQEKTILAQEKRALTTKLIDEGYSLDAINKYFQTNDAKSLGSPRQTVVRTGESRTMMSTDPAMYNKPIVVHTVEEKTGKQKGAKYEVAMIDGKEVRLDSLQRQGLSLVPFSETTHGVTGKTERQSKNVEAASKVADSILVAELGADNVKGKANPNRKGMPTAPEIATQAGSYFSNIGFDLSNGTQMQEARSLMSVATRDMLADKNSGVTVNSIEPYLARNVITQRMGIDPNALMLSKDKAMNPEKIVDLNNMARRLSATTNGGKPNEAQATSEIQRLHQVWANPKSAKLREQFKGTSNETAFYQFATEALRKSLEK